MFKFIIMSFNYNNNIFIILENLKVLEKKNKHLEFSNLPKLIV